MFEKIRDGSEIKLLCINQIRIISVSNLPAIQVRQPLLFQMCNAKKSTFHETIMSSYISRS